MARVPYPTRDDLPPPDRPAFDRLIRERGPVNVFLAIANATDLLDSFLTFTSDMKHKAQVDQRLRELAIAMVGTTSGARYELDHHAPIALAAGVRPAQLAALAAFESSEEFDDTERAVLRYARLAAAGTAVPDDAWRALLDALGLRPTMDIVFAAAWYSAVARILIPLEIELEDGFAPFEADLGHAHDDHDTRHPS